MNASSSTFRLCFGDSKGVAATCASISNPSLFLLTVTARALLVEAGFRATRINGQDKFQFHVFHAGRYFLSRYHEQEYQNACSNSSLVRATLSKDELKGVETTVSIVENSIDRNALHADDEKQARTKAKQVCCLSFLRK